MGYIYDLHVHSCECSKCASMTAREAVRAYKERGFAGIALTNHFIRGNNRVPAGLPWAERMDYYRKAFLSARDEGERLGMDVFFGIEEHTETGRKYLFTAYRRISLRKTRICAIYLRRSFARVSAPRAVFGIISHIRFAGWMSPLWTAQRCSTPRIPRARTKAHSASAAKTGLCPLPVRIPIM